MKNSKFVQLLRTLKQKEVRDFEKYLHNIYGKHKVALHLFKHINKYYNKNENVMLEKAYIAEKVLRVSNVKRVSNESSKLFDWLEEYLVFKKIKSDAFKYERERIMLQILKERNLDNLFFRKIEEIKKIIELAPVDSKFHFKLMDLNFENYIHDSTDKSKYDSVKFQEIEFHLNSFYKVNQLKLDIESIFRKNILQNQAVDIHSSTPDQLLLIYETIFNLLGEFDFEKYKCLKELVLEPDLEIQQEEHLIIIGYMVNICSFQLRKGVPAFIHEIFCLYDYSITQQLIPPNQIIHHSLYENIVIVGCEIGNFDWVSVFMENYTDCLKKELRNDTVYICQAHILMKQSLYSKALDLIHELKFSNIFYKLRSHWIMLLCYYKLSDFDSIFLEYKILSFKKFISRHQGFSKSILSGTNNLISIIEKLSTLKENKQVVDSEKRNLLKEVEQLPLIYFKSWIINEVKNL